MANLNFSPERFSSLQTENEKKYLPSAEEKIPGLDAGTDIYQFYFPADKLNVSRTDGDLFHRDQKKPLIRLSDDEVRIIEEFINSRKNPKARLRLTDYQGQKRAFFTMKLDLRERGSSVNPGLHVIRNSEFEREIDYKLARKIFDEFVPKAHSIIYKTRHLIKDSMDLNPDAKPFEVDFFHGPLNVPNPDRRIADNSGLIMIEKELPSGISPSRENLPQWIGEDITHDPRFTNSQLSQKPYARWQEADKPAILSQIKHFYP